MAVREFILLGDKYPINSKRLVIAQETVPPYTVISVGYILTKNTFHTFKDSSLNDKKLYSINDRNITYIKSLYKNSKGVYYTDGDKNIYLDIYQLMELDKYISYQREYFSQTPNIRPTTYKHLIK